MRRQIPPLVQTLALGLAAGSLTVAHAQRSIASVPTAEATLSGPSIVQGPDTILRADGLQNQPDEITAQVHPAHLKLVRGGTLLLCQASALTLTSTQNLPQLLKDTFDPLLVTLTRGALELAMPLLPGDTLVTPEMRLESASYKARAVPLNLALHVDGNGDTCVENHAEKSSPIIVSDVFGASKYTLKPGDHVLFQHGMVDSAIAPSDRPCGCPPPSAGPSSLGIQSAVDGTPRPGFDPSSAAFPFPIVASQKNALPLDQPPTTAPSNSEVGLQASLTYEAPALATPSAPPPAQPIAPVPAPTVPGLPPALIISAPPQTQPPQPVSAEPVPPTPPTIPRPFHQEAHLETPPALVIVLPPEALSESPMPARKLAVPAPLPSTAKAAEIKPTPAPPVQPPVAPPARPAAEPIIVYVPPAPKPAPPNAPTPAAILAPTSPPPARPKHATKPKVTPAPPPAPAEAPKPPKPEPPSAAAVSPVMPQSAPAEQPHGVVGSVTSASRTVGRSIGHFFKRLFTQ